ncbi:Frataxin, mitochondrial [Sesamum angolense]|uniref:Frataxin, mitochondrial n=1 Tax=Sesamum angolense TaxID=2727404 RepID=A0AAE1W3S4_9LAMI|nr:Frataxin, mitochondrial [Sesamum angolense]
MAARLLRRALLRASRPLPSSSPVTSQSSLLFSLSESSTSANSPPFSPPNFSCNSICCHRLSSLSEESHGPAPIDYRSSLQEDDYHRLANSTIHDLLEKLEEYGDSVEIDGYDVDYGNEVLTLKLGSLGTYVINKQTPKTDLDVISSELTEYFCLTKASYDTVIRS